MQNYFNYFTEIEQRFQQRRGALQMLSTLDWALIESWREAGIPLEAVLSGIDTAFDKHDAKTLKTPDGHRKIKKINGLAWATQSVMEAVEQAREASIGIAPAADQAKTERESGFETERVAAHLEQNAALLEKFTPPMTETATRLRELSAGLRTTDSVPSLEALDRTLSVLEEKMVATILASAPETELLALREQAARELAPYKGKMQAVQIKQVQQQLLQKRLLEARRLPRLSLFYMPHE